MASKILTRNSIIVITHTKDLNVVICEIAKAKYTRIHYYLLTDLMDYALQ